MRSSEHQRHPRRGISADGTLIAVSTSSSVTSGAVITGGNGADPPTTTVTAGTGPTVAPTPFVAPTTTIDPIVPVQVLGATETAKGQVLAKTGSLIPQPLRSLQLWSLQAWGFDLGLCCDGTVFSHVHLDGTRTLVECLTVVEADRRH
jgi:hypothetical protein